MHVFDLQDLDFIRKAQFEKVYTCQGLRASSLQFTSPLEFNAIFRDGFPLRVDLNG